MQKAVIAALVSLLAVNSVYAQRGGGAPTGEKAIPRVCFTRFDAVVWYADYDLRRGRITKTEHDRLIAEGEIDFEICKTQ